MNVQELYKALGHEKYYALAEAKRTTAGKAIIGLVELEIAESRKRVEAMAKDAGDNEIRFCLGEISGFKRILRLLDEAGKSNIGGGGFEP